MNDREPSSPVDPGAPPLWVEPAGVARVALLVLHGLDMTPEQLRPLVGSLKLPALVALPSGPVERPGGLRSWWPVDDVQRARRLANGAADLHASDPPGRERARALVHAAAQALQARAPGLPLVVAGFSQGAMLALDAVFHDPSLPVSALALWSASRMAFDDWTPALRRVDGVRIDMLHGRADANIAIAAAQSLRDALAAGGADVRWSTFDGGHEIPLQAWVGLRRLVRESGFPPSAAAAGV